MAWYSQSSKDPKEKKLKEDLEKKQNTQQEARIQNETKKRQRRQIITLEESRLNTEIRRIEQERNTLLHEEEGIKRQILQAKQTLEQSARKRVRGATEGLDIARTTKRLQDELNQLTQKKEDLTKKLTKIQHAIFNKRRTTAKVSQSKKDIEKEIELGRRLVILEKNVPVLKKDITAQEVQIKEKKHTLAQAEVEMRQLKQKRDAVEKKSVSKAATSTTSGTTAKATTQVPSATPAVTPPSASTDRTALLQRTLKRQADTLEETITTLKGEVSALEKKIAEMKEVFSREESEIKQIKQQLLQTEESQKRQEATETNLSKQEELRTKQDEEQAKTVLSTVERSIQDVTKKIQDLANRSQEQKNLTQKSGREELTAQQTLHMAEQKLLDRDRRVKILDIELHDKKTQKDKLEAELRTLQ